MKNRKILIIATIAMLPFSGAFGTSKDPQPIHAEKVGKTPEIGKFQAIKLINGLKDYKIEVLLNENAKTNEKRLESLELTGKGEEILSIPIKGGARINRLRLKISNLANNTQIDSGSIEFDWMNNDQASVLEALMNQLKAKGINATVKRESDVLTISIQE